MCETSELTLLIVNTSTGLGFCLKFTRAIWDVQWKHQGLSPLVSRIGYTLTGTLFVSRGFLWGLQFPPTFICPIFFTKSKNVLVDSLSPQLNIRIRLTGKPLVRGTSMLKITTLAWILVVAWIGVTTSHKIEPTFTLSWSMPVIVSEV